MSDDEDENHGPNKACSSTQDIWNFERIKLYNSSIVEAYFLPLSTCSSQQSKCNQQSLWRRLTNNWLAAEPKLKHQSKARAGERKRKSEARLTISPLECSAIS